MIPWLEHDSPFPDPETAMDGTTDWPGLLCAGEGLDADRLQAAYSKGIFPWYSAGQPVLWWSPDPRMVLQPDQLCVRRSLRKRIAQMKEAGWELRVDTAFSQVLNACAAAPRRGQAGTWITPAIASAYTELHRRGLAHSVETWHNGRLIGGLYAVAIGRGVFGESMFSHESDASKVALCALVAICRPQGVEWIDCQQQTSHLATMGARPIARSRFLRDVALAVQAPGIVWQLSPVYWDSLFQPDSTA